MKNRIITVICAVMVLVGGASLNAAIQEGPYVSATGSFVFSEKNFSRQVRTIGESASHKDSFGGSIAVGHIVDQWRVELEGLYRKRRIKNGEFRDTGGNSLTISKFGGHVRDIAAMANVYYDICLNHYMSDLKAYLGAGIGMTWTRKWKAGGPIEDASKAFQMKGTRRSFAWQALAGLSYDISENVTAFAGYRLFMHKKVSGAKHHPMTHSVDAGLRFIF